METSVKFNSTEMEELFYDDKQRSAFVGDGRVNDSQRSWTKHYVHLVSWVECVGQLKLSKRFVLVVLFISNKFGLNCMMCRQILAYPYRQKLCHIATTMKDHMKQFTENYVKPVLVAAEKPGPGGLRDTIYYYASESSTHC